MSKPVTVGLIGIGGHARRHLGALLTLSSVGMCRLAGVADPFSDRHPGTVSALKYQEVDVYQEAEKLFAREDIEAVVIATPIPLHMIQALQALSSGKHVYLEKPPCVTLEQFNSLRAEQAKSGTVCSVGFQLQSSPSIQFLKKQLCEEAIGKLSMVWTSARWRRDDAYYGRTGWAGKWCVEDQPVFDGPATNALSHAVHAVMYLAGSEQDKWAKVRRVRGCLKKARPIESYDSVFVEAESESGVSARLALTHATATQEEVVLRCIGERGQISLTWSGGVHLNLHDGQTQEWHFPFETHYGATLNFFHSLRDSETQPATSLEDCRAYLQTVNGALQSSGGAPSFDSSEIEHVGEAPHSIYTVAGLDEQLVTFGKDGSEIPSLLAPGEWIDADRIAPSLSI